MTILAAVVSVQLFLGHLKEGRLTEAYALMLPAAKQALGRTQFDTYIESRKRVLGPIVSVSNIRPSKELEIEGMEVYEADVKFEKGTAKSWFILANGGVYRFGLDMPEGKASVRNDADAEPIMREILEATKMNGVPSIVPRFSQKDLEDAGQNIEQARNAFEMVDAHVGKLVSYTLGKPAEDSENCVGANGQGKFQYGDGPITIRLCWADGIWRLRHLEITPQLTPSMLERSLAWALKGEVTAKCPRTAAFPVNGTIVCRLTPKNEPPQDATILRTTESGWKIVGLQAVK